jgi:hypothetical protein
MFGGRDTPATTAPSPSSTARTGGAQGNETARTGDTADKVKAAVLDANAAATVESLTTKDDGSATNDAHITKSDNTRATVKLDTNFTITATETGGPGGH